MKGALFALAATLSATSALADPLGDALEASDGIVCFTRSYDAAWLKSHPGQTLREAKFMVTHRGADPWRVLRMSLKSDHGTLYLFGGCEWYEGDINRGVQDNILIESFKPESGVGCHLMTDVTGASAEEGGDFPVDWQEGGQRIEVHLDESGAAWRSLDVERNAEFVDFNPADRIIRLNRAPAAACDDLAKFAPGQPQ